MRVADNFAKVSKWYHFFKKMRYRRKCRVSYFPHLSMLAMLWQLGARNSHTWLRNTIHVHFGEYRRAWDKFEIISCSQWCRFLQWTCEYLLKHIWIVSMIVKINKKHPKNTPFLTYLFNFLTWNHGRQSSVVALTRKSIADGLRNPLVSLTNAWKTTNLWKSPLSSN